MVLPPSLLRSFFTPKERREDLWLRNHILPTLSTEVESKDGDRVRLGRMMVEEARLKVHLEEVLPLEAAAKAHELSESRHTRGKIVLAL